MTNAEEFYKKLRDQLQSDFPFVAYRKPGEILVKALLQEEKKTFKIGDYTECGFAFAPFDANASVYLIPSEYSEFTQYQPISREEEALGNPSVSAFDFEFSEMDQKDHESLVQKGIDHIRDGEFKKVVLSRSEEVMVLDPDPLQIFKKLLDRYPQAMVYLWSHPETGIWLGATPETLLKAERNKFQTMALAGTQVFSGETDVEWESKEVEEQLFVTDFILENLENLENVENIKTTRPYSARAGNLLHICTDILGNLKDPENLGSLIKTLHPTPAVCGLPRDSALRFIIQNENHSREFYSGFMGELNIKTENKRSSNRRNQENQQFKSITKQTELYVNLRCMKLKDGKANIFVGGGITKDSNAADEWMETVNKSQTMKSVLVK
ncbi:chorismate-binding protein [Gramella lutea]|uniref:Chorismate-binding protein n=1 Tax=Christiangramia lutea TaxID=1607951 RepID=A0A9X1V4Z2_9FLAO|nr:chorismate-binding protein [Christiangramia lutea]MCH4823746.1 chorismate-binding protein [Christiangramia lutea]